MAYKYYNPNPIANNTMDCSTRAISKALDTSWDDAHIMIFISSLNMGEVMQNDAVWGSVLRKNGFKREIIPNTCPDCYTVDDFCKDHPIGIYVLGFGNHVATIVDGDLYDSWDSSHMVPVYYWFKEDMKNEQSIPAVERGTSTSGSAPIPVATN